MMRRILVLLLALATPIIASAQLGDLLVPFAPKDCINDARGAVGGAGNTPRLIALFSAAVELPLGTDTVNIGMSTKDGKARLWYYVFVASDKDTIAAAPMVRVVFACQDPTSLAGGETPGLPIDGLSTKPLPAGYKEGSALAAALAANSEFTRFTTAYPDTMPGISTLTTSEEDAFSFPAGTPFWVISWIDIGGVVSGEPFLCLVHSVTGQTLCGDQLVLSVSEINDPSVYIAPNPVRDNAILNLPISWIGKPVVIEAVSTSGAIIEIMSVGALTSPVTTINGSNLTSGAYTLRARTATDYIVLPMSVIR